jgi:membrane protein required for colicin V production
MFAISEQFAPLIGFIIVFVTIYVLVYILFKVLEKILKALALGPVDKLIGGVIGAFKLALAISIVFVVMGHFGLPSSKVRAESTLYAPVESIAPATWNVISRAIPNASRLSDKVGERLNPVSRGARRRGN